MRGKLLLGFASEMPKYSARWALLWELIKKNRKRSLALHTALRTAVYQRRQLFFPSGMPDRALFCEQLMEQWSWAAILMSSFDSSPILVSSATGLKTSLKKKTVRFADHEPKRNGGSGYENVACHSVFPGREIVFVGRMLVSREKELGKWRCMHFFFFFDSITFESIIL